MGFVRLGVIGTKKRQSKTLPLFLVPVIGVEPIRYRYHWILSPARLPIPSHRRILLDSLQTHIVYHNSFQKSSVFFSFLKISHTQANSHAARGMAVDKYENQFFLRAANATQAAASSRDIVAPMVSADWQPLFSGISTVPSPSPSLPFPSSFPSPSPSLSLGGGVSSACSSSYFSTARSAV